jgi:NADH-quinone oxidoreductase subunit M
MSNEVAILSLIIFLPALGAIGLLFLPKDNTAAIRLVTLAVTLAVFALTVFLAIPAGGDDPSLRFEIGQAGMQNVFNVSWIPSFNIQYYMGMDGISFPLVILTSFLSVLSFWASWSVKKQVKGFCILFLLLETGMLGVFLSLDFFLFYIFWEVMLLPMYFLIGVWGGKRREYAAIKFFLYTLLGSVLMLIAILMLYFASDLRELSEEQLIASHVPTQMVQEVLAAADSDVAGDEKHTFNLPALAQLGQTTTVFDRELVLFDLFGFRFGRTIQWWAFLLLFLGFAVKVPIVPLHTWLPDAHVEAPTPISMILAGVLLKMGGYGIIRICYPICPDGGFDLAYLVCGIGVLSMVYGAFAAMAQTDFKRLVAYSSVSHMGYVVLGLGVWSAGLGNNYDWEYWAMGVNGAMFQMIGHGISSAGMFFMVGVVYDRVHHREINQFGGLFRRMPLYAGLSVPIFFAGLGLPGLCGFIGEVFVTLSVWNYSHLLAVITASVVILTAGYILWTIQRVYLGTDYKGPNGEKLTPITLREQAIVWPLIVCAVLFGVYPKIVFDYMTPTINAQVQELADWTRDVKAPRLAAENAAEEAEAEAEPAETATSDATPLNQVSTTSAQTHETLAVDMAINRSR